MIAAPCRERLPHVAMRRDFAAANPAAVDSVCRAIIEAYGLIFNKENKQAVKVSPGSSAAQS
jgi:ABC-type nitrate/sulfonate/bicarbonate transport system substrate-binding protein